MSNPTIHRIQRFCLHFRWISSNIDLVLLCAEQLNCYHSVWVKPAPGMLCVRLHRRSVEIRFHLNSHYRFRLKRDENENFDHKKSQTNKRKNTVQTTNYKQKSNWTHFKRWWCKLVIHCGTADCKSKWLLRSFDQILDVSLSMFSLHDALILIGRTEVGDFLICRKLILPSNFGEKCGNFVHKIDFYDTNRQTDLRQKNRTTCSLTRKKRNEHSTTGMCPVTKDRRGIFVRFYRDLVLPARINCSKNQKLSKIIVCEAQVCKFSFHSTFETFIILSKQLRIWRHFCFTYTM